MLIAVTGGSGFLGQHVVSLLAEQGHHVRILDVVAPRFSNPDSADADSVTYVYEDLEDPNSIRQSIGDSEVVMHLAAVSNTNKAFEDPDRCMVVNSLGTQNVYEAVRMTDHCHRVVLAGSTLVSGALQEDRKRGTIDGAPIVDEFSPVGLSLVTHPYVMSKVHAEMIAGVYQHNYDVESTVFRYGIQYGRDMAPGVVAHAFITRALRGEKLVIHGDGEQWRQYTHVEDIAAAHALLVKDGLKGEHVGTFNVCGDEKVRIKDMAEVVCELTDAGYEHGPAREDDIPVKFCSNEKAKKVLKWKPTIGLRDGLADAIEWYKGR